MENILYYPYINIPRTEWTLRTLLYYDTMGTIVPREYLDNPKDNFDPFMLELVKTGLVLPIDPMQSLKNPLEFSNNFNEYIKKHEKRLRRGTMGAAQIKTSLNNQKFSGVDIHGEKFDSEIFYSLQQLGLAEHHEGNWFRVERSIANLLMKSLATSIGVDLEMLPTTDEINSSVYMSQKREIITKRNTILNKLIPFPENIDLKKLRKFKDKHLDLLKSFKNRIEIIALDPNIKVGTGHFEEILKELELRKEELSAKMSESQLGNIIFGTVCGIIAAGQGIIASGNTIGGILNGLPGFATAAHSALKIEKNEKISDQSGLKYLALIDRKISRKI